MTIDEIVAWFNEEREPKLTSDEAVALLARTHPRTVFIKTLPADREVLHIGAEYGAMDVFLRWPSPGRQDLLMSALVGSLTADLAGYAQVETANLSEPVGAYENKKFGAAVCSMVLQRLADPMPLLTWISEHTQSQGRIFLEWPSPFSTLLPARSTLKAVNIDLAISHFSDDPSNIQLHERSRIASALSKTGFFIESQGYISLPFVEGEILAHVARGLKDDYAVQTAYWSKTKWLQYIVGVRN